LFVAHSKTIPPATGATVCVLSLLLKVEITFAKKKLATSIAGEETFFIICTALWV
jgi:hypothetical protein